MRRPRRPEVSLPALRQHDGGLAAEGDHDAVELADLDLTAADGAGATFLECAVRRCTLDRARLRRARLVDTVLEEVRGVGMDLSEATLRDVELRDARCGSLRLGGGDLRRVLVRGGKFDYLALRQARLVDVTFAGCVLVEPDFSGARLERVAFVDCDVRGADLHAATFRDVDLRGCSRLEITGGLDRLAGAVVTPTQLVDLAPALAAAWGLRVEAGP